MINTRRVLLFKMCAWYGFKSLCTQVLKATTHKELDEIELKLKNYKEPLKNETL